MPKDCDMNNRTRTELILEEKLDTECVWSFKNPSLWSTRTCCPNCGFRCLIWPELKIRDKINSPWGFSLYTLVGQHKLCSLPMHLLDCLPLHDNLLAFLLDQPLQLLQQKDTSSIDPVDSVQGQTIICKLLWYVSSVKSYYNPELDS